MPVTQVMVDLLCAILDRTNDLKGFAANQVVRMWPAHFEQFGKVQTIMGEADREVLHITDVKVVQAKISASSKEKALQAAVEDKVLQEQAAITNDAVAEANSSVVNLAAFNMKAAIFAALRHVKNVEQTLHRSGSSSQGVAKSLQNARQSLEEGWQDAQTVLNAKRASKACRNSYG